MDIGIFLNGLSIGVWCTVMLPTWMVGTKVSWKLVDEWGEVRFIIDREV